MSAALGRKLRKIHGEESVEECVVCRGVGEGEGVAQHVKL